MKLQKNLPLLHIHVASQHLYLLRYIPLTRAALAISVVFGYFSKNAITSFFMSYIRILAVILPIAGMIIFPLFTVYLTDFIKRNSRSDIKQ